MSCFGDRTNSSRYANQAKSCCFSPKTPKSGVKRTVKGFLRRLSGSKDTQVNIMCRAQVAGIVIWMTEGIVSCLGKKVGIESWLGKKAGIVSWLGKKVGIVARNESGMAWSERGFVD